MFRNISGIKNAQIIQQDRTSIVVNIVLEENYDFNVIKTQVLRELKDILGVEMKIEVRKVEELILSRDGKYRLVISNI